MSSKRSPTTTAVSNGSGNAKTVDLVTRAPEGLSPEPSSSVDTAFVWLDAPPVIRVFQRGLRIRATDAGKYAVYVHLHAEFSGFITPATAIDKMFWVNGLDGCEYVHQCIALFDDRDAAGTAVMGFKRLGSSLFRIEIVDSEARLVLEDTEARAAAPTA